MLAPSSLVLITTLFSAPSAHAGYWAFSATGSTYTPTVTQGTPSPGPGLPSWTPPALATSNSFAFTKTTVGATDAETTRNPSCACSATLALTIIAKWTHYTGQTDTTDPAPTRAWIMENSNASWSGNINVAGPGGGGGNDTAQGPGGDSQPAVSPTPVCTCTGYKALDGLGDAESDLPLGAPLSGSSMTSTAQTTPPPGWSTPPVSGGTITLTRNLSAQVTAAGNVPCTANASCTLSYTVSIHAQPYNLRYGGYTTNGVVYPQRVVDPADAILIFSYLWDSTDGVKADLASCQINENVTWDSNPPGVGVIGTDKSGNKVYFPPSPPVGVVPNTNPPIHVANPDPTILGGPATANGATDTFSPDAYFTGAPYRNISWWGDQTYVFSDSATGEKNIPILGPAAGSFRITRTVAPIANTTTFGYTISSRGYSAGPATLPAQ